MSMVDEYKAVSNTLNDELINLDKQIDELKEQRKKTIEEIAYNDYSIENVTNYPTLGYLTFDSIKVVLSYLAKQKHELLYCVSKYFRSYKLSTYYYKLTNAKSLDFYFNHNGFRDNLLKSVVNPSQQVALKITNNGNISDTSCLASVHSLVLNYCTNISSVSLLGNIHYLDLTGTKGFKDISALTNVHTLILNNCAAKLNKFGSLSNLRVFQISKNDHICDLSSLINCEELIISNCRKIEYIHLNKIEKLSVVDCSGLVKIEGTRRAKEVTINNCFSLTDIRSISCVEGKIKLELKACPSLVDINYLGFCYDVTLSDCYGIIDISSLAKCHQVVIRRCMKVTDVSALGGVHELTIEYSSDNWQYRVLTGVSSLGKVHTLRLSGLDITDADIKCLGTVNTLHLSDCRTVNVSPLVTVKKLTLKSMVVDVEELKVLRGSVEEFHYYPYWPLEEITSNN